MIYELRYFFDAGGGVCLWAKNDAAKKHFGYAVEHWDLPLSENTKRWLQHLVAWFDTSLDWESPADPVDRWPTEERQRFRQAVDLGFDFLLRELPAAEYLVVNEASI